MKRRWKCIVLIGMLLVVLVVALCVAGVSEAVKQRQLVVLEHEMSDEFLGPLVVGIARNDTG